EANADTALNPSPARETTAQRSRDTGQGPREPERRRQLARGMLLPGGADSNQDRKPVKASGPMAISIGSSSSDRHRSTRDPMGTAYDSVPTGSRRATISSVSRRNTRLGPTRRLHTRYQTHSSPR